MTAETFDWTDPDTGEKHSCAIPGGLPNPPGDGKTVGEILDQMRNGPIPPHRRDREMLVWLADRLDAAVMRERAVAATIAATQAVNMTEERCRRDFGGNVAKMREVLEDATNELQILLDRYVPQYPSGRYINRFSKTATLRRKLEYVIGNVKAALAAPPRNCDRPEFKNGEDAWLAFEKENPDWCDNHQSKSFWCDDCESAGCDRCMADWLMSQATTEKGGAECQQK